MKNHEIRSVSFSQDGSQLAIGRAGGLAVVDTNSLEESSVRLEAGVKIAKVLPRSKHAAIVGSGGSGEHFPSQKVFVLDCAAKRLTSELSFKGDVLDVFVRPDLLTIVLERKIFVYRFSNFSLVTVVDTAPNPRGLCCWSSDPSHAVMCCPGLQRGSIRIQRFDMLSMVLVALAHESHVASMAIDATGSHIATASETGTIVRLFSAFDGTLLGEYRRGYSSAVLYELCFSPGSQFLAAAEAPNNIHIFKLSNTQATPPGQANGDPNGAGNAVMQVGNAVRHYVQMSYASCVSALQAAPFAQITLPASDEGSLKPVIVFASPQLLLVASQGGLLFKYAIERNGETSLQSCTQLVRVPVPVASTPSTAPPDDEDMMEKATTAWAVGASFAPNASPKRSREKLDQEDDEWVLLDRDSWRA